MKKLIILAIILLFCSSAYADDLSDLTAQEAAPDSTADFLYIIDVTTPKKIAPLYLMELLEGSLDPGFEIHADNLPAASAGDVSGVGVSGSECLTGACLDGSSDGGEQIALYDGDSNSATFDIPNISGDVTYTMPSQTGTIAVVEPEEIASITMEYPTPSEDVGMSPPFVPMAVTITECRAVLVGSATPSVTWTVRHGTDRSAAGAEVVTGGTTTTSTTTGSDVTVFNDATIVADSFIWLETTEQDGTVVSMSVSCWGTID